MTDQLDDFFADYRAGLTPEIAPAGPGAVRATVRRRRRIAATALVATAVVLVAAPVAGYAALNRDTAPGPAPAVSNTPTLQETTPAPEESTTTPPPPSPPDGRISRAQLLAATVDLPPWQSNAPAATCTRQDVRLGAERGSRQPWLQDLVHGDADADGATETIATIACVPGQADMQQVVVFDRDTRGRIITLGQVVRTEPDELGWVIDVTPAGEGVVKVRVGDLMPCCDMSEEQVQKQDRTYTWNGTGFRQTGGPTEFPARPDFRTDLRVTASDLVFTDDKDGYPHGVMTVTIKNAGPRDTINMSVSFDFAGLDVAREGPGWGSCETVQPPASEGGAHANCVLKDPFAAGESRQIRFHVAAASVPEGLTGSVEVAHFDAGAMGDLKQEDNRATFDLRR